MKILVKGLFSLAAMLLALGAAAELRITEICPKTAEVYDANGLESGWVELYNDGEEPVDLADYELVRVNRGKKLEPGAKKKNLAKLSLGPGETLRVWTSEEYSNCKDLGGSGNVEVFDGRMVYPNKVNPKKFPYLALYHKTDTTNLVDAVAIPVDIKDGATFERDWSIGTRYAWKIVIDGASGGQGLTALPYGPNVGPLYGVKHSESDLAPTAVATSGVPYSVSLAVNPFSGSTMPGDAIEAVTLEFCCDFGATNAVTMTKSDKADKSKGWMWSAEIPASAIPSEPGRLIRWRAKITDGDGNVWTSPSFCNPDDGYAWYGTITEPGTLDDAKLQTWHMFVEGENNLAQMDVDADKQNLSLVPYNARCSVYDSQTGMYYDNVRIDLRGNTSGGFRKKSHGFRFSKCQPMTCVNPLEENAKFRKIETRKTSLVAEYCDPAYVRQSLAFHLIRESGGYAPFHYPVRVNLNGAFYQLAFHSNRFSDELIEDWHEFDEKGYGYKNSGTLSPTLSGDRLAGSTIPCEKKTPDDGVETGAAALRQLAAWTASFGGSLIKGVDDQPAVCRAVVETFDLPAWINYLAATRITMECDDSYANLSSYGDVNVTGTWRPLAYDMNQSWGHIYNGQWNGQKITPGEVMANPYAEEDRHKAHPFYGGMRVISHNAAGADDNRPNYAFEAVWQSTKFRRLYLRRLRSLMDEWLGAPGTPKEDTKAWRYVVAVTNATHECAILDYEKWRAHESNPAGPGTFWTKTGTFCWTGKITHDQGVEDLWMNYIIPRRRHLFETHSITNTEKGIGYAQNLSAGIPDAQLSAASLVGCLSLVGQTADELILFNNCDEAIDLSGWTLSGGVMGTLPAGTVVDAKDTITLVRDRKSWIAANRGDLGDRVVVGNFDFAGSGDVVLTAAADAGGGAAPFVPSGRVFRWFDASVQNIARGTDVTTVDASEFRGAFAARGAASGTVASRLGFGFIDVRGDCAAGDRLVFTPSEAQKRRRVSVVEMAASFPDAIEVHDPPEGGLGALTLARTAEGLTFSVYDGSAWRAVSHPSVVPAEDVTYRVRLTLDFKSATPTIVYAIGSGDGWVDLADAKDITAFPIEGKASSFAFSGFGEVGGFGGDYELLPGFGVRLR